MHNINPAERLDLGQIERQRLEGAFEFLFSSFGDFVPWFLAAYMKIAFIACWRPQQWTSTGTLRANSRLRYST